MLQINNTLNLDSWCRVIVFRTMALPQLSISPEILQVWATTTGLVVHTTRQNDYLDEKSRVSLGHIDMSFSSVKTVESGSNRSIILGDSRTLSDENICVGIIFFRQNQGVVAATPCPPGSSATDVDIHTLTCLSLGTWSIRFPS